MAEVRGAYVSADNAVSTFAENNTKPYVLNPIVYSV
jgi:hypothetical protein